MPTLLDKWKLMKTIASNPELTGADKAVAIHLLDLCNERGEAWPSYETLAVRARQTARNVMKCIARLIGAGYFAVEKSTGRGHANVYKPAFESAERVNARTLFDGGERVNGETPFEEAERVNARVVKGERAGKKRVNARSPHSFKRYHSDPVRESAGKRGSRLPSDWTLPPAWRGWAQENHPSIDLNLEAAKFRDYWIAVSGAKGVKADWQATWRNWCRSARAAPSNVANRTKSEATADLLDKNDHARRVRRAVRMEFDL
jgi:hypothetical protein